MTEIIIIILLIVVVYILTIVIKLDYQLKGMSYRLDQVAKKVELPEYPINDQLRKLINDGRDVEAVKVARETLGLSLIDGKKYVDSLKDENK